VCSSLSPATNIAETSLTIPGIRFVVDSGVTKMRMYDVRTGSEMLRVVEVSQAEAQQRSGRAGRDAPGVAYRLYTESSFSSLKPNLLPEILRSNLASVVLQLKSLRVANVLSFDFMTRPSRANLTRALEELYTLRALTYNGELSDLGRLMVHFPLAPNFAKILIKSAEAPFECSVECCKILAMMSVESVFFVPAKGAVASGGAEGKGSVMGAFAQAKKQFAHAEGDHFTYLDVYNAYSTVANSAAASGASTSAQSRRMAEWCRAHYINHRNMVKVQKIYEQLSGMMRRLGLAMVSSNERETGNEFSNVVDTEPIKRALILGLFAKVARKQAHDSSYLTLGDGLVVHIHPSSVLIARPLAARPLVVVYNELVQTSRSYMRDCMELPDMKWLVELVPECYAGAGSAAAGEEGALKGAAHIKGGKQQADLHKRLASTNANHSKLSGGGGAAGAGNAARQNAPSTPANNSNNGAATPQSKSAKKAAKKAAATAALAASTPAPPLPPMQDGSAKKQKRPKKDAIGGGKASALLDFVNALDS